MNDYQIRRTVHGDEEKIARVHIQAWQEAYKNILPQDYLDDLPSSMEDRVKMWKNSIAHQQRWSFVAETNKEIVGFILFGPPRDKDKNSFIELGAIYLLASEKNKGIGFSLLSAGFDLMKNLGYHRAYCWVLENNPTIQFYEKTGARFSGNKKVDEIGGKNHNELCYDWPSLNIK